MFYILYRTMPFATCATPFRTLKVQTLDIQEFGRILCAYRDIAKKGLHLFFTLLKWLFCYSKMAVAPFPKKANAPLRQLPDLPNLYLTFFLPLRTKKQMALKSYFSYKKFQVFFFRFFSLLPQNPVGFCLKGALEKMKKASRYQKATALWGSLLVCVSIYLPIICQRISTHSHKFVPKTHYHFKQCKNKESNLPLAA